MKNVIDLQLLLSEYENNCKAVKYVFKMRKRLVAEDY